jgi:hypothetical protein
VVTGSESPADLAILLYLADPEALKRCHGKLIVERMRTYESYQTDRRPLPDFRMPEATVLERLRKELEGWFENKLKGKGVRVITSDNAPWFGFIFRHGDLMRREGAVEEDGTSGSIVFRPERFDAVFYNASLGELRLNAKSKTEKNKYRTAIGEHLFGDDAFFPPVQERYTLEPLRQNSRDSLFCGDVVGIKAVRLTRAKLYLGGPYSEVRIVEGTDVFDIFEDAGEDFPPEGKIMSATFEIVFEGAKKPRKLTIRTPNVASFSRDSDTPVIESWLQKRGFILAPSEELLEPVSRS